jgi:hypothetical protein
MTRHFMRREIWFNKGSIYLNDEKKYIYWYKEYKDPFVFVMVVTYWYKRTIIHKNGRYGYYTSNLMPRELYSMISKYCDRFTTQKEECDLVEKYLRESKDTQTICLLYGYDKARKMHEMLYKLYDTCFNNGKSVVLYNNASVINYCKPPK